MGTPSCVELPLWCGHLRIKTHSIAKDIGVLVVTPISSWNHKLVHEWSEFSEYGLNVFQTRHYNMYFINIFKFTPRNARSFPPIVRMKGITTADKQKLLQVAEYLNNSNQVLCKNTRNRHSLSSPMNVIIMTRTQALSKLKEYTHMNVSPTAIKSIYSSLNYDSNNSSNHGSNEIQNMEQSSSDDSSNNKSDELFAFIEVQSYEAFNSSLTVIKNDLTHVRKNYDELKN